MSILLALSLLLGQFYSISLIVLSREEIVERHLRSCYTVELLLIWVALPTFGQKVVVLEYSQIFNQLCVPLFFKFYAPFCTAVFLLFIPFQNRYSFLGVTHHMRAEVRGLRVRFRYRLYFRQNAFGAQDARTCSGRTVNFCVFIIVDVGNISWWLRQIGDYL